MHLDITNLKDYSAGLGFKEDNKKLTVCECDKPLRNSNILKNIDVGRSMQNKNYEQLKMEEGKMKVILEFPQDSKDEDSVKEVKSILSRMLQEHIEKIS